MRITSGIVAVVAAIVSLSLGTPARFVVAQAADVIDDLETYAVYASVLPARFSSGDTDLTRVALLSETRAHMDCLPRVEPAWTSVIDNYKTANARVRQLRQGFDLGVPYTLVTPDPRMKYTPESTDDLRAFYAQFPNGKLLSVSAVGFDETRTRALVTVQYDCGFDCAGCWHALREKIDGRWRQPQGNIGTCTWIV
jgi:hypothetical protein